METQPKRGIAQTIATFTAPAVGAGIITKAELDSALSLITEVKEEEAKRDRLLTYKDAAGQLGVSTKTIFRMIESGELVAKRLRKSNPRSTRVFQSSVDALLTPEPQIRTGGLNG